MAGRALLLLSLAGCRFHGPGVDGDGGNPLSALRLDTAAELGEAGSELGDIAIDPRGTAVLTPAAYHRGGVIARGAATCPFATPAAIDWALIDAVAADGIAFVDGTTADVNALPPGVRIAPDTAWMYWIEGEVQLPAGASDIALAADDWGAVEIALPHTRAFTRLITTDFTAPKTVAFLAPAADWYPVRAMICQTNGGGSSLDLKQGPTGAAAAIPRDRLRARAEQLRGTVMTTWREQLLGGASWSSLAAAPLIAEPFNTLPPGLTDDQYFSARWAGQVRIDVAGDYTLAGDTDDGNRIFLGTALSGDHFSDGGPDVMASVTATLRTGWNPIVLDYSQYSGAAHTNVTLTAAPTGVTTGVPLPLDHLRPVATPTSRTTSFDENVGSPIPNNPATPVVRTWRAIPLGDEVVSEIWLEYRYTHGMVKELSARLIGPDGTAVVVRTTNDATASPAFVRVVGFAGKLLAGAWKLEVTDNSGAMTGTLDGWTITAVTTGGPPVLAPLARWTSATHALGATALDSVHFAATTPATSGATAWVRTCDVTPCTDEAWTGPYADGDAVTVAAKPYAQLRVELTATASDEAELDWIELRYRAD